jgi:hypothetical protein
MRVTGQPLIILLLLVLVLAGIGWVALHERTVPGPQRLWFYDLKTGKLFAAGIAELPPLAAPSDAPTDEPSGVLATVVRMAGEPEPTIAFLQTYTPQARELVARSRNDDDHTVADPVRIMRGTLVALPPTTPGGAVIWVPMSSPEGSAITMKLDLVSGGKPYQIDLP